MAENVQSLTAPRGLRGSDLGVPAAVMAVILFMLFPLPSFALDLMLGMNLAFAVLVLLVTLYITEPLQFSSFPPLLLVATLLRLSFNVAATRLILTHGGEGTAAAPAGLVEGLWHAGRRRQQRRRRLHRLHHPGDLSSSW